MAMTGLGGPQPGLSQAGPQSCITGGAEVDAGDCSFTSEASRTPHSAGVTQKLREEHRPLSGLCSTAHRGFKAAAAPYTGHVAESDETSLKKLYVC